MRPTAVETGASTRTLRSRAVEAGGCMDQMRPRAVEASDVTVKVRPRAVEGPPTWRTCDPILNLMQFSKALHIFNGII